MAKNNRNLDNNDEKILLEVEKFVEKEWDNISHEISQKKSKRNPKDYENINLEVMISRISEDSKPKKKSSNAWKRILYIIYIVLICFTLYIWIRFFSKNMPHL